MNKLCFVSRLTPPALLRSFRRRRGSAAADWFTEGSGARGRHSPQTFHCLFHSQFMGSFQLVRPLLLFCVMPVYAPLPRCRQIDGPTGETQVACEVTELLIQVQVWKRSNAEYTAHFGSRLDAQLRKQSSVHLAPQGFLPPLHYFLFTARSMYIWAGTQFPSFCL